LSGAQTNLVDDLLSCVEKLVGTFAGNLGGGVENLPHSAVDACGAFLFCLPGPIQAVGNHRLHLADQIGNECFAVVELLANDGLPFFHGRRDRRRARRHSRQVVERHHRAAPP
jgi:hypothetical protein